MKKLIYKKSAGGVVFRVRNNKIEYYICRTRFNAWVLPKGGIEYGETPLVAARREIREETGYTVGEYTMDLGSAMYEFRSKLIGEKIQKTVYFFAFEIDPEQKQLELMLDPGEMIKGGEWSNFELAYTRMVHDTEKSMLKKVHEFHDWCKYE